MDVYGFLGMRGTGDWATDERPKNWRQGILRLYPNGKAPLTAIMSKMSQQSTDDPEFNWWSKTLPTQGGAVTGVYTDVGLGTAATIAGVSGTTYYAKVAEAIADEFREGHGAILRVSTDPTADVAAKVTAVVKNGASSYIAVKLLETDDNSLTSNTIVNCDQILSIGSINPEGGAMPDAIAYKPVKYTNYTQIFRDALSITGTAKATKLRTEDSYKEAKREALELHSIGMEKAYIFGVPTEGTGANGKPERTTGGLLYFIRTYASGNVSNFTLDSNYASKTWLEKGEEWLDTKLEVIFRYGSNSKLAFIGSGALLGLQKLVKNIGTFNFTAATGAYGIKVLEWVTPFGQINMITHPLLSYNATDRYSMIIFEPRLLKYRFLEGRDTNFIPDKSSGANRTDSKEEEFLTEAGLELHFPEACGYLVGVGQDNTTV